MVLSVKVETREETTKSELKELRSEGKIPAVVYGRKIGSELISIDERQLMNLLRDNPNAVLDMNIPEVGPQKVMLGDIQRDQITRQYLHVDFHQINMDQKVKASVRLDFTGEAAGVTAGGMLQIQKNELEVRCLAAEIPETIRVDISHLEQGDLLTVSDIQLPKGTEANDHADEVLVSILMPRIVDDEPAAKDDAADAEDQDTPEVESKEEQTT
jgi:large subunit ribosomal protein L25